MDSRSPFYLSFPLGTWFQTQVRISIFFVLTLLLFWLQAGLVLGSLVFVIMFVSVLLHEFGHVFAARATGGEGDEIVLWPLGGLAYVRPAHDTTAEVITNAAGPFVNALLTVTCLSVMWYRGPKIDAQLFSLFTLPPVTLRSDLLGDILLLTASINFKLLCVNLIPALPLDGGQIVYAIIKDYGEPQETRRQFLYYGAMVSVLLLFVGIFFGDILPIVLAFCVAVFNIQEYLVLTLTDQWGESFAGGYPGRDDEALERKPGVIARWKQKRAAERQQRDEEERIETERRVDELLAKIHREGKDSLSDAEKRFLTRVSQRYRNQEH